MLRTQYLPPPPPPSRLKRKRDPVEELEADVPLSLDERPPPSKRAHSLEDGFSLMSLASPSSSAGPGVPWSPEHVTLQPESAIARVAEVLDSPVVEMADDPSENASAGNGSGEENHDIEMKRSTWYEKDKDHIVILDLDSDDDDDETPQSSPPREWEFTISSALLSRLPVPVIDVPPPPPAAAGQLVLYRPPLWKDLEEAQTRSRNVDQQDVVPGPEETVPSDEAMEIEDVLRDVGAIDASMY
ncbi:hypothetical protein CALVIDRAFT_538045 [Calocera viscosa TUFC12733]|uniref:Uncharacterized protein n=1 Tax=Calocera viscosa (strain TUFC12733) TaxID=1330018 RepID=A0A167LFT5_CALVF|nr:hypothetical protein CALVIDRAFT_538045 [Calocera viscosa TUFC12733]